MKDTLLAGSGAAVGALARYALGVLIPSPLTLLVAINAVGCFLIARWKPSPFWTIGVLGGFTSYSAFQAQFSLPYFAAMLGTCLLAYLFGELTTSRKRLTPS
ncbi:CrcB family protein [Corynebacterium epidermidicanis]|uniref:Fluoride-specific ion channel n=1 Tax=Corynebacterium epidermidicanis TaxID=1050174 RepID=A0A0G3GRR8_9CORY|nr:CrcB family protein [Corynebacterium epidermidicanis]AKK03886.1 CrcB-like protein [Corynebacterium epidermidicanis]